MHATEPSNASRTLLFNLKTGSWDEDMLKLGVDAINIAPELGAAQTRVVLRLGKLFPEEYQNFYNHVLDMGYWKRWVTSEVTDPDTFVTSGGHYCFRSKEYEKLLFAIGKDNSLIEELRNEVFGILDTYRKGLT